MFLFEKHEGFSNVSLKEDRALLEEDRNI